MSSGTAFGTLGDPPGPLKTYVFLKEFNDFHYCGNPDFSSVLGSHPRRPRGPRGPREAGFSAPAPLPLDTFTRLFLEYTILLTPSFLIAPHAGPRGRRIQFWAVAEGVGLGYGEERPTGGTQSDLTTTRLGRNQAIPEDKNLLTTLAHYTHLT